MKESELVYKLKDDDIFYFLHIPKTAGTTFIDIIDKHFDDKSILPEQLWEQLLPKLPINFSKYRLIRGHFGYGIRRVLPKKPVYVTMLRDPIERSISWYNFVCSAAEKHVDVKTLLFDKTSKLSDLIVHPRKKDNFENVHTRFLSKDLLSSFSDQQKIKQPNALKSIFLAPVDSSDLEIAKKHLLEFPFFGLTERFEDSIFLLCYTFCWKPIRNIVKKNVGKNRKTTKDFSKEVIDTLVNLNELDTNLYNFAQKLFEIRFNQMINELKKKYYEPRFEDISFKQMMYEMLEKHYYEKLRDSLNDIRMNETISKEQPHFSSKESSNILKEIKVKKKLLDTLDTEFSFGEKHMSLISFLFNKQISQKYLNALKYFILHESLEKQNEINTILVDSIIELIKQSEDKSKINIENILTRLEKIEKHLSK